METDERNVFVDENTIWDLEKKSFSGRVSPLDAQIRPGRADYLLRIIIIINGDDFYWDRIAWNSITKRGVSSNEGVRYRTKFQTVN